MKNKSNERTTEYCGNPSEGYLKHHTTITAKHGWFDLNLRELWRYRDLMVMFVKKDFSLIYKQTILGPLWIFLVPFITTVIYTVVFGNIAKLSTDGVPKLLFYMTGNALWSFFAECINKTANTFKNNANVFGKVYFPRLTKPIATVIFAGINFCIQMLMFFAFWIYYIVQDAVHPNWVYLPLLIIVLPVMGCMALGCGIIVSSLTTKYRDLAIAVTFGVSLWMYATPVVYPLSMAGSGLMRTVLLVNPVTQMMEIFRFVLLGEGVITIGGCVWSGVFTVIVLLLGVMLFNKVEKTFMDTV